MEITNKNIDHGKAFDWGKTSEEYAKYLPSTRFPLALATAFPVCVRSTIILRSYSAKASMTVIISLPIGTAVKWVSDDFK